MLFYTHGNIQTLVYMYSINVFLTFSLSQLGMTRFWKDRPKIRTRKRHLAIHIVALLLCVGILVVTVFERFLHGGWVTILITSIFVLICFGIHKHYKRSAEGLRQARRHPRHAAGDGRGQAPRASIPRRRRRCCWSRASPASASTRCSRSCGTFPGLY